MNKKHNFSACPCILPQEVFEKSAQAILDFNGIGLSLLEISHRSKDFVAVMDEARAIVKRLMNLNDDYELYNNALDLDMKIGNVYETKLTMDTIPWNKITPAV